MDFFPVATAVPSCAVQKKRTEKEKEIEDMFFYLCPQNLYRFYCVTEFTLVVGVWVGRCCATGMVMLCLWYSFKLSALHTSVAGCCWTFVVVMLSLCFLCISYCIVLQVSQVKWWGIYILMSVELILVFKRELEFSWKISTHSCHSRVGKISTEIDWFLKFNCNTQSFAKLTSGGNRILQITSECLIVHDRHKLH